MVEPHQHNGTDNTQVDFKELKNFFQFGTSLPTYKPKGPADSIYVYLNGSTERLYFYNFNNKTWTYCTTGSFPTVPNGDYILTTDPAYYTWSTFPITVDADLGWTIAAAGFTNYLNGCDVAANGAANARINVYAGAGGRSNILNFDDEFYIKVVASPQTATTANIRTWFGMATDTLAQNNSDITNVTRRVGFSWSGGKLYGVCGDNTAVTATELATRAGTVWDLLVIKFTPSAVTFYVNGTGTTVTTNIPNNSGSPFLQMGGYDLGGSGCGISIYNGSISVKYQA